MKTLNSLNTLSPDFIKSTLHKNFITFNTNNKPELENIRLVFTLIKELEINKNILLTDRLIHNMIKLTKEQIHIIIDTLYNKQVGHFLYKNYTSLPDDILFKQILEYYVSYNLDINSASFFYDFFNKEATDNLKNDSNIIDNKFRIIDFKDEVQYKEEIKDTLIMPVVWGKTQKEFLTFANELNVLVPCLVDIDFKVKENLFFILTLVKDISTLNLFKTANDILRYCYFVNSTEEEFKFKFKTSEKRIIMSALNELDLDSAINDMKPKKRTWLSIGQNIHPGSTKYKKFSTTQQIFDILRNKKYVTFNTKLQYLINNNDMLALTELLTKKPGELLRRLDLIIRKSNDTEFNSIIEIISSVKLNPKLILNLRKYLKHRTLNDIDTRIFNLGSKIVSVQDKGLDKLDKTKVKRINEILNDKLTEHLKSKSLKLKED